MGTVTYVESAQAPRAVAKLNMRAVEGHAVTVEIRPPHKEELSPEANRFTLVMTSGPSQEGEDMIIPIAERATAEEGARETDRGAHEERRRDREPQNSRPQRSRSRSPRESLSPYLSPKNAAGAGPAGTPADRENPLPLARP